MMKVRSTAIPTCLLLHILISARYPRPRASDAKEEREVHDEINFLKSLHCTCIARFERQSSLAGKGGEAAGRADGPLGYSLTRTSLPRPGPRPSIYSLEMMPPRPPSVLLKAVSLDVTGTLLRYRGHIGDIYGLAPRKYGYPAISDENIHEAFKKAYRECCERYPCFGHKAMNSKDWWRLCVRRTFEEAGQTHPGPVADKIFRYIYASFGSVRAYELFQDSHGFVQWLRGKGLQTGIVSNATDRYGDSVLPMLGLHEDLDFMVLSSEVGYEKPDPRIFQLAMAEAGVDRPQEMLHIGDSYKKDYLPAVGMGMHAVLLDRFHTKEAETWRKDGIPVFTDLDSVKGWMVAEGLVTEREESSSGNKTPLKAAAPVGGDGDAGGRHRTRDSKAGP